MSRSTGFMDAIVIQKATQDFKTSHEAGAAGGDVPIASNLHGVFFRQHRIKDWLFRKTRRESSHVRVLDQFQFPRSNRTPESYDIPGCLVSHVIPSASHSPRSTAACAVRSR